MLRKDFHVAYDCYQDFLYVCAYLEKKYKDILDVYRAGEPGMPEQFVKTLPPLKRTFSKKMISRVVEMREIEKATFISIAKELRIAPAKAKHTYEMFHHRQVLEFVDSLLKEAKSYEEKADIWNRYFGKHRSAKKSYEFMISDRKQSNI